MNKEKGGAGSSVVELPAPPDFPQTKKASAPVLPVLAPGHVVAGSVAAVMGILC